MKSIQAIINSLENEYNFWHNSTPLCDCTEWEVLKYRIKELENSLALAQQEATLEAKVWNLVFIEL